LSLQPPSSSINGKKKNITADVQSSAMRLALIAFLLTLPSGAFADNKGLCPSINSGTRPGRPVHRDPPSPEMQHAGDVMVLAVISDTGYVCSVRLLAGFDHEADQQALATSKGWRLHPAMKDGRAVPVQVVLQLTFLARI
jgi:TonB family protein